MTTATAEKPADTNGKTEAAPLEFSCEFGGYSGNKETASIAIKFSTKEVPVKICQQRFCGHRLDLAMRTTPEGGEDARQLSLGENGYEEMEGTADVGSVSLKSDGKTAGMKLVFSAADVDQAQFVLFSEKPGRLTIISSAEVPKKEKPPKGEENAQKTGLPKPNTTGIDELIGKPIEALCPYGITETAASNLVDAVGGDTVGHLEAFLREHPNDWAKSVKSCGAATKDRTLEALRKARYEHPMPENSLPFKGEKE